jgi:hypothetical protein
MFVLNSNTDDTFIVPFGQLSTYKGKGTKNMKYAHTYVVHSMASKKLFAL